MKSFSRCREELEVLPITIELELEPELADFSSDIFPNDGEANNPKDHQETENPKLTNYFATNEATSNRNYFLN